MARLNRYFIPDQHQHVIQRGNSREPVFAAEDDYRVYQGCLADALYRTQSRARGKGDSTGRLPLVELTSALAATGDAKAPQQALANEPAWK